MNYPIFVDSLPKSGTHLLARALTMLPGIAHSGTHLERRSIARFVDPDIDYPVEGREDIDIQNDIVWIERLLASIPSGQFLTAHMNYHPKTHAALKSLNYKILVAIRDPRDVVLSWAEFIAKEETHLLYPFFKDTDLDYRITCGIQGVTSEITKTRPQPSIARLVNWHLKWKTQANAFVVLFENLVGEKGGSTRDRQRGVLEDLCKSLGAGCSADTIDSICDSLFGGTYTFNRGVIGRWKESFTDNHKALFKSQAGQLLIDAGYETDFGW
ncbi:MAG: sulfotransferase domain-containing protein [Desulfobacteraceae bacterium]|nr:sulfotransferase domain-containing protein [Desulfobacteraceae bacterium]MBC2754898.1 sulfotransferase domain-containing protein [Desulfobacteraceae bacterium]